MHPSPSLELLPERLPRGRHNLDPALVRAQQDHRAKRAVLDEVAAFGYEATSVSDVCRRAGISRETFYRAFGSRAECYTAAVTDVRAGLEAAVIEAGSGATPAGDLRRALAALQAAAERDPAGVRSLLEEVPPRLTEVQAQRRALGEIGVRWLQDRLGTTDRLRCLALLTVVRHAVLRTRGTDARAVDAVMAVAASLWPEHALA